MESAFKLPLPHLTPYPLPTAQAPLVVLVWLMLGISGPLSLGRLGDGWWFLLSPHPAPSSASGVVDAGYFWPPIAGMHQLMDGAHD